MKSIKFIVLVGVLALLPLLAGGGVAQISDPAGGNSPSDTVLAAISYQGVLTDPGGHPLSGTCDLQFTFWSDDAGGSQIGSTIYRWGESITNGLYSTDLEVDPGTIYGQEMWLRIQVREIGGAWETLSPRVQVLPTTYALTVRPGARSQGSVDVPNAIVMATNTSSGWGLRGESTEYSGYGVYGYNGSASSDAYGGGVIGITRTDGYGVRGEAPSSGDFCYGGYFVGRTGVRSYGTGTEPLYDYGGYFIAQRRAIYAASLEGYYAGYFDGPIYVDGTIYPSSATRTLVVNGSDETLEAGDVVAISGIAEPLENGGEPLLAVRKTSGAADMAVVGVVAEAMHVEEVERPEAPPGQRSVDVEPVGESIPPGGYLAIITHGLVPAVKVTAAAAESLRVGDLLGPAESGKAQIAGEHHAALGKVAGPYDPRSGTVPVFVILD